VRDPVPAEESPDRRDACRDTGLGELSPDLLQRDVRLLLNKRQDQRCMSFDVRGAAVAAQRPWRN